MASSPAGAKGTMQAMFTSIEKTIQTIGILRLKDLIKAVRACKTAADERAVIARESAFIRTQFKEENVETRGVNVAKLLYIHMLGYPAHFGQIECLKLVVSPRFSDKRLGYLGIMLLLDENQETLTLVTNSLKNDMNHPNMYIVGLALCTLGNICSPEMGRDLSADVERLLASSNAFIRKKAALAALRIVRKVPELAENYYQRSKILLGEKNHGVLLTGVTLLTEMCRMCPDMVPDARSLVPQLVRHLKNLVTAGFSPEHDVSGVTDPFLQIKILRLLRLLGNGDSAASEQMNDVLAQVATNTEGSKNVGNSILYEVVLTIMNIQSESSLRVLAINILGKFLSNRDNNIRYVALTTLAKVQAAPGAAPSSDSSALQRHRSTILDCLRDPDISIRRRALELSFQLANTQNIRVLTRELLSFLEVAEGDLKGNVGAKICEVAASYRPNRRWEIDTICRVLKVAGAYVEQDVVNDFIKTVSTAPTELQAYTVRKLHAFVGRGGDSNPLLQQEGLVIAAIWCIGEYGEVLVSGNATTSEVGDDDDKDDAAVVAPSEKDVVDTIEAVLKGPLATDLVKEYGVTALMKLTSRFKGNDDRIRALISRYRANIDVEIQQRANEYLSLFNLDKATRDAVLDKMPVLEAAVAEEAQKGKGEPMDKAGNTAESKAPGAQTNGVAAGLLGADLLQSGPGVGAAGAGAGGLDVLSSIFGGGPSPAVAGSAKSPSDHDHLVDLFGSGPSKAAPPSAVLSPTSPVGGMALMGGPIPTSSPISATAPKPASNVDLLSDLFGGSTAGPPLARPAIASAQPPAKPADPFAGLMGGGSAPPLQSKPSFAQPSFAPTTPKVATPVMPAGGGLGMFSNASAQPTSAAAVAYNKNGLAISLASTRTPGDVNNTVTINAEFRNTGAAPIGNVQLQVAVPKALKIQILPPSGNQLVPGGTLTQVFHVQNPTKAAIKLRLKVGYAAAGVAPVDEIVDFAFADASLWA